MSEELIVRVEVTTQQIAASPTCQHMQVGQQLKEKKETQPWELILTEDNMH